MDGEGKGMKSFWSDGEEEGKIIRGLQLLG